MKRSLDVNAWYGGGWSPPEDVPDYLHTNSSRPKPELIPKDADVLQRVGIVLGRFRPPHLGHRHLIEQAFSQCGFLHVVIPVPRGWTEAQARAIGAESAFDDYANVRYEHAFDGDHDPRNWAQRLRYMRPTPTHVFSSDPSPNGAAAFAKAFAGIGIEHVLIDPKRRAFPVSSTMIRNDPENMFHWIVPDARHHYVTFVELVGPEGSGKTTLAHELATLFRAPLVEDEVRNAAARAGGVPSEVQWQEAFSLSWDRRANAVKEADTGVVIDDSGISLTSLWATRLGVKRPQGHLAEYARKPMWLVCHDDFTPPDEWKSAMGERYDPAARAAFAAEVERLASVRDPDAVIQIRGEGPERVDVAANAIRAARTATLAKLKSLSPQR